MDLLTQLRLQPAKVRAETADLKLIGISEGQYAVTNLVRSCTEPVLSLASSSVTNHANLVVNARVAVPPEDIAEIVREARETKPHREVRQPQRLTHCTASGRGGPCQLND